MLLNNISKKAFELLKGDCLELMKEIPDKSIDMILCDLPYGTTACKWDIIIPFESLWEQYGRIIKDNGAIVLFGSEPFSTLLRYSNLKMYKYEWVWNKRKSSSALNATYQPLKVHENILVFSKKSSSYSVKGTMNYFPQGLKPCNKLNKRSSTKGETFHSNPNKPTIQRFTNYPKSIIEFATESGLHPTQKPVALLEYLIKTYTNEGDVVLDNCMGSGSTGVACINTNRCFIGIEKDDNFMEIAKQRINNISKERGIVNSGKRKSLSMVIC